MKPVSGVLIGIWILIGAGLAVLFATKPALLSAQRATAATTLALGWATVLLALLTRQYAEHTSALVGETKKYSTHTEALVGETREANRDARAAMKAQLRPVVVVRVRSRDGRTYLCVDNIGLGPAMNVKVEERWYRLEGSEKRYDLYPDTDLKLATCVAPSEDVSKLPKLNLDPTAPGTEDDVIMRGYIRITYGDIYEQQFESVLDNGKWSLGPLPE